jgi:hypothetical protein
MTKNEIKRNLIKEKFEYLITEFSFIEDLNLTKDNIYSEVRYKKSDWTISIVTIAHGSKISLSLISPNNDFGFINYYLKVLDKSFEDKLNKINNFEENVKFHADFLKQNGDKITSGKNNLLTEILEFITKEHDKNLIQFLNTK